MVIFQRGKKNKLKPKVELYIWLCIIISFFSFCLSVIGFFVNEFLLLTAGSVAIFGISFYGIFWSLGLKNQILKGFGVKKVEDTATLFIHYKNNDIPIYLMKIGGLSFKLDKETYDAFVETEYRVYYFKLLRNELLSAEPIN
jgi:hypothetical protein